MCNAGDEWHKGVIEVQHAEETAEFVDGSRCRHFPGGTDFFGQRVDRNGVNAKNVLRLLDNEAMIGEVLEKSAKCSVSFLLATKTLSR